MTPPAADMPTPAGRPRRVRPAAFDAGSPPALVALVMSVTVLGGFVVAGTLPEPDAPGGRARRRRHGPPAAGLGGGPSRAGLSAARRRAAASRASSRSSPAGTGHSTSSRSPASAVTRSSWPTCTRARCSAASSSACPSRTGSSRSSSGTGSRPSASATSGRSRRADRRSRDRSRSSVSPVGQRGGLRRLGVPGSARADRRGAGGDDRRGRGGVMTRRRSARALVPASRALPPTAAARLLALRRRRGARPGSWRSPSRTCSARCRRPGGLLSWGLVILYAAPGRGARLPPRSLRARADPAADRGVRLGGGGRHHAVGDRERRVGRRGRPPRRTGVRRRDGPPRSPPRSSRRS